MPSRPQENKKKIYAPQSDDNFNGKKPGIQWQFNHNPDDSKISLTDKKGWLCIVPQKAEKLRMAKNQLTQKTMGNRGTATVKIDFSRLEEGGRMGLECIGNKFVGAGVMISSENGAAVPYLYCEKDGTVTKKTALPSVKKQMLYIRLEIDALHNKHQFYYSEDGKEFVSLGESFESGSGDWKGSRVGLYAYTTDEPSGRAYFDDFTYHFDGPGKAGQHTK